MHQIKTMNNISATVGSILTPDRYLIDDAVTAPEGILVRSAKCHDMVFNPELRAIARAGAGTNNLPVERCTEAGIVVFNTPGANANAVKELVFAAMLMNARNLADAVNWCKSIAEEGEAIPDLVESSKKRFTGHELLGKKLGVIGLGAIGVMVANEGYALGMEVCGYDPFISIAHAWGLSRAVSRSTSLEDLLHSCDYVSIHVPLSDKTHHYINADALSQFKRGATLLNFSRGDLVDDHAVLQALAAGQISNYITDFPNQNLVKQQGVTCIPHLGASTPESEENCAVMAARELKDYLENGNINNSVNMPNCTMPRSGGMRICLIHRNAPNMIGQFTGLLSKRHANISNMINQSRGDMAYTIIDLDEKVNNGLENGLAALDHVIRVLVLDD